MEEAAKKDVRNVIEEISQAYDDFSAHDQMNGDYASFATMAVAQFREALSNPALSRDELATMLRAAITRHRSCEITREHEKSWTKFAASYMVKASNINEVSSIH